MSSRRKQRVDDNDDGPGGTAVDTTPPNRKKSRQSATKTAGNIVGGPVSSSSSSSSSTKTVLDKIMYAIRNQPATAKGVSRTAISKYIKSELSFDNEAALKRAIKKGVDDGKLIQTGQSFWIAGDPDPSNKQQQQQSTALKIEDMQVGEGEAAKAGDTVIVEYEGSLQDGTVFDSADTFEFCLGIGEVIKGAFRSDLRYSCSRRVPFSIRLIVLVLPLQC